MWPKRPERPTGGVRQDVGRRGGAECLRGEPAGTTRQPAALWRKVGGSQGAVTPVIGVGGRRPGLGDEGGEVDLPPKRRRAVTSRLGGTVTPFVIGRWSLEIRGL